MSNSLAPVSLFIFALIGIVVFRGYEVIYPEALKLVASHNHSSSTAELEQAATFVIIFFLGCCQWSLNLLAAGVYTGIYSKVWLPLCCGLVVLISTPVFINVVF